MKKSEKAIFDIMDSMRGASSRPDILSLVQACKDRDIEVGIEELLFIITRMGEHPDHFVPVDIAEFIAQLIEPYSPRNLLDPWAGMGLLTIPIKNRLKMENVEAYTVNQTHFKIWELLHEDSDVTLHNADALSALKNSSDEFDAIVSCPPWGLHAQGPLTIKVGDNEVSVKDDYSHLLILESCQHLSNKGVGVFVVYNRFFYDSEKVRDILKQQGICVTAAIQLPAGSFSPLTTISTHIIILQRASSQTIFTGKYASNAKHQKALLKNLRNYEEGASSVLGRIVDSKSFRGFSPIEINERLTEQVRRMGLVPYSFNDVVKELNIPTPKRDFEGLPEKPNSVYLPMMAATPATTSQKDLPERLKSYYQLVLDPEIADAAFLAGLLNTSFGQLWRDSLRSGITISRIGKEALKESTIYLPPKESRQIQRQVVECRQDIRRLINELRELETQLWKRPAEIRKIRQSFSKVNREDRFQDWIDTLPFPLASILWVCHTQGGSYREKFERKIHFFEALAEFLAIVFLSAFTRHSNWIEVKEKITEILERNKLSLQMATFGTWKIIVEVLSSETRKILSDEPELCFELFKTRDRELIETICSKKLVTIVQDTNEIRNDRMGHVGAISESEARSVDEQLGQYLENVREAFGISWEGYSLLLPGSCKIKQGMFEYTVRKVMGSRTPFPSDNIELAEPLEDNHLHLWNPNETRALKLLPLVKVMPSPKTEENACYFYNRLEGDSIRFLSYYFDSDSEVINQFSEVADALRIVVGNHIEDDQ